MSICTSALFLASMVVSPVWFTVPGEAEEKTESVEAAEAPPWKHKLGIRFGTAAFSRGSIAGTVSLFYENQLDPNLALRYALEISGGQENYKEATPNTTVRRVGAALEGIYYNSDGTHDGTGYYGLAGLGVHRIDVVSDDGSGWRYTESIKIVPALSIGIGYHFGRSFGMEYKHTFSVSGTTFPENTGEWGQFTLNFRFPALGLVK